MGSQRAGGHGDRMPAAPTAAHVRAWARRTARRLEAAREELDAANVFPVADHDTGTNLAVTARAAADALSAEPAVTDAAVALRRLATGAVRAARGNSGVILSQVLRGLADHAAAGTWDLPGALGQAATCARAAVADPVEGTMLTVATAAADAAATAVDRHPAAVARTALAAARAAVAASPDHLPALGGAADAGARGLVVLYETLCEVLTGELDPSTPEPEPPPSPAADHDHEHDHDHDHDRTAHTGTPGGPGYEVQYLLELPAGADTSATVGRLAEALGPLGDSLVLADDGAGLWAVHVHVDDVGAAVEAGATAVARGGAMSGVRVTRFADTTAGAVTPGEAPAGRQAVVVASGADLGPARSLFAGLAVTVLGPGEPFPAGELVVVAVGDAATTAAMRHADQVAGVSVVPARAVVQAVAAVAVHEPSRRGVDDTVAMAEAAAGCRYASLTVAAGDALTIVGRAHEGDVLGLIGEEVAVIGADHPDVACRLLDRLLASGGELVTVLHRTDAAVLAADLVAHVRVTGDHLDVEVRDVGDVLDSPVLIGVE